MSSRADTFNTSETSAIEQIRADFPVLKQTVHGKPLVYLDNAATTQKPQQVIDAVKNYYTHDNANVHRGLHTLSERATDQYEQARNKVRDYINAASSNEIIFTRGTTESINLVAQSFGRSRLKPGDEIIISTMEHHSNIVPWQLTCEQTGATLKVIPISDAGELDLDAYKKLLSKNTRLVALVHASNALGTVNPVTDIIELAHAQDVPVLLDGAQAIAHMPVDVQALDCDFYAFSAHKAFGPTGIGVLYGKEKLLDAMPPYQGGGEMIRTVSFERSEYGQLPNKFEAGTPHIAGAIGLGAAIDYISALDFSAIHQHESSVLEYAHQRAADYPGLKIIGQAKNKISVLSFVLDYAHPHDIGTIVDHEGVAIRVGHHCAMPLMDRLCVPATARASFSIYNTHADVDALFTGLDSVRSLFG